MVFDIANVAFLVLIAFLTLILFGLSLISLWRGKTEEYSSNYEPKTLVILPCRGLDYSFTENLNSLKRQTYGNYDLMAIVDSEEDEAVPYIKEAEIEYSVSDFKCTRCSGKVRAISTILEKNKGYGAYVIADSDILVKEDWLESLIRPLGRSSVGISTTFPYFNPVQGFWSRVKSVWGFVGHSMMESKLTRFGWGGSLAFRKELLDKDSFLVFSESLSDDTALTRVCHQKGLEIYYSPRAEPTINSPDDFHTFIEWANRQTALSISASRKVLYYGVVFYSATILLFLSAIVLTVFSSPVFAIYFLPTLVTQVKSFKRANKKFLSMILINLLIPFLYLANLLVANAMRQIKWRGRQYDLQRFE